MKQTAVEYLVNKINNDFENNDFLINYANEIQQAKEMENKKAHEYAEFAIMCDRKGMNILNFEDWIKL